MNSTQTQIHFFYLKDWYAKCWAFTQMQLAHAVLSKTPGLRFYKLLGTGGGDGYQWQPDFGTYALLTVFEDQNQSEAFYQSRWFQKYRKNCSQVKSFHLQAFEGHGFWDGHQPFEIFDPQENYPVAVLTRARIKWKFLRKFWQKVPKVSASLQHYPGQLFGKGIGELPLIQQATFSVWENKEAVMAYAYQNPKHREVVQMTRKLGWYAEEMFVRFHVMNLQKNNPTQ